MRPTPPRPLATRLTVLLSGFVLASAVTAWADDPESVLNSGHVSALNQVCAQGRSGRSWVLESPEINARTVGSLVESVVPSTGRTDIVGFLPMGIVPCVRVSVATDVQGRSTWDLAVDTDNVNRGFELTDINTGEPLQFCPDDP